MKMTEATFSLDKFQHPDLTRPIDVTTIIYKGEPYWNANQIGRILGYSNNGKNLATSLSKTCEEDFIEGRDFIYFRDEKKNRKGPVPKLLLLSESGLYLAIMTSRKPVRKLFRRWMVETIFPRLKQSRNLVPIPDSSRVEITIDDITIRGDGNLYLFGKGHGAFVMRASQVDILTKAINSTLNLMRVKKSHQGPRLLMNAKYWRGLK